eukprot:Em0018g343a
MPNFKAEKLKTNLKLCINRLKLLEKKKTEGAMKARKEIADYIKTHRLERARVRVEHIIREDYLVEALEVLELYCDLLLARFGLLEQKAYCDDTLVEAVSTLIWASPRLVADVQEFGIIAHQFEEKFGKEFAHQARSNLSGTVNAKVIHRLGVEPIKKSLIENYLVEIARNYHQEYQPDPSAFLDDDAPPPMDGKPFIPSEEFVQEGNPYTAEATAPPAPHLLPPQYPSYGGPSPTQGPPPSLPGSHPGLPYSTAPPPAATPAPAQSRTMDLPSVPSHTFPEPPSGGDGDVDFDDLTRRFEDLKRRK